MFFPVKKWWCRVNPRSIRFLKSKFDGRLIAKKLIRSHSYTFISDLLPNDFYIPPGFNVDLIYKLEKHHKGTRIKFFDIKNRHCYSFPRWEHSLSLFENEFRVLQELDTESFTNIRTPRPVKILDHGKGYIEELFVEGKPCTDQQSVTTCLKLAAKDLSSFYTNRLHGNVTCSNSISELEVFSEHDEYSKELHELLNRYQKLLADVKYPIPLAQVHGDFSHNNILELNHDKVGIFDWEFTRIAPVFYDLANFALHYSRNDVNRWLANIEIFGRYFEFPDKANRKFGKTEIAALYSLYRLLFQFQSRSGDTFETSTLLEKHQNLVKELIYISN